MGHALNARARDWYHACSTDSLYMGRAGFLVLCLWAMVPVAGGQILRGFVADASTGEPLEGVNIALTRTDGVLFGAASNSDGLYLVPRLTPGQYVLAVTYVGYVTLRDSLILEERESRTMDFDLEPDDVLLEQITVEDDRAAGITNIAAGLERIAPASIERIPTPDVSADLAAYLTTLPGVVLVGDQGGQFYVRGGEPTQNLVLLDGMLIYQPFHILSYYSAFPSEVLRTVELHAGAFGPRFGGRVSSVVDAWSRNGNNQEYTASASMSPFLAGTHVEGPLTPSGRFSMLASVRQSVVEQLASNVIQRDIPLEFRDLFAKIHGRPNQHGRVSFSGIKTFDRGQIGLGRGIAAPEEIRWINEALGGRYLFLPGNLPLLAEFMGSWSRHEMELGHREAPIRMSTTDRINMEANITHYSRRGDLRWGLFARTLSLKSELGGLYQDLALKREWVTEAGMYAAPEFKLGRGRSITPGIRVHHFPSKGVVYLEPRLRANWVLGLNELSLAAGTYHQEIVGIHDRRDAASVFTAWTAVPSGDVPRALHVGAGFRRPILEGLPLAVDVYYKSLENLYVAEWTARPRLTTRLQQADGRAMGLDVRAEYSIASWYGSLNYGLASVRYTAKQETLVHWFDEPTYSFRPAHDRRHQLNALLATSGWGFDWSISWQFGSGRPFNRALGFDGFLLMDGSVDVFSEPGERRVVYDRPFNGVLPTYHRLDVAVDRSFNVKYATVTAQASVINVYDRANIFYLDVFTLERADQLPIIPSFGIRVDLD